MKKLFLMLSIPALLAAGCDGGSDEDDADADAGEVIDDRMDPAPEDVADDRVDVADVAEEEPQDEVIDAVDAPDDADDADAMDVEHEPFPSCADQAMSCDMTSNGMVDETSEGNLDKYVVHSRTLEYDESGSEYIFGFEADGVYRAHVEIADYSDGNLDIIILRGDCDPDLAIAWGDSVASFMTEEGALYYIVVDGRDGTDGYFELTLECGEEFEICDNDEDDDDDELVDCDDPDCEIEPACYEVFCGDDADDDGDGDTDCEDWDCFGAVDCVGGPGEIEDACDSHDDCATGMCFMELETGWPAGYCTYGSFVFDCDHIECPGDEHCEPYGFFAIDGPWLCLRECDDVPCRDGYMCEDHVCYAMCDHSDQCVEAGFCELNVGFCTTEPQETCDGGEDEDGDTLTDCDDWDCMFRTDCLAFEALQPGDTCDDAAELTLPEGERGTIGVTGDTEEGFSNDYTPSCEAIDSEEGVYSFTLTAPALAQIDVVGGRIEPRIQDTILYLRSDCGGEDIACNNDVYETVYFRSFIEAELAAGTYYIFVDAFDTLHGQYHLGLNLSDPE